MIVTGVLGGATEFVYGQNPGIGVPPLVFGVGLPTSPSLLPNDPFGETVWDNSSIIATGTVFTMPVLPTFVLVAANESILGTIQASTIGLTVIRVFTFVPEPSTALLGTVALAMSFVRRKR